MREGRGSWWWEASGRQEPRKEKPIPLRALTFSFLYPRCLPEEENYKLTSEAHCCKSPTNTPTRDLCSTCTLYSLLLTSPPLFIPKRKSPTSQPELLFHKILHSRESLWLVGLFSSQYRAVKKLTWSITSTLRKSTKKSSTQGLHSSGRESRRYQRCARLCAALSWWQEIFPVRVKVFLDVWVIRFCTWNFPCERQSIFLDVCDISLHLTCPEQRCPHPIQDSRAIKQPGWGLVRPQN